MSDFDEICSEPKWYVLHTKTNYENRVKANLETIVRNNGLQDLIMDTRIPTITKEAVVGEDKEGNPKVKKIEEKIFPGYVYIKMIMSDRTWHIVRNVNGVTGFVGPGSRPAPLEDSEVANLGFVEETVALDFRVGDSIRIIDGTMKGFIGTVESISEDKKKINVLVSMFGRETPYNGLDSSWAERLY